MPPDNTSADGQSPYWKDNFSGSQSGAVESSPVGSCPINSDPIDSYIHYSGGPGANRSGNAGYNSPPNFDDKTNAEPSRDGKPYVGYGNKISFKYKL